MEAHGYRVATADEPRDALNLLVALTPAVVVVDASLLTWEAPACRRLRQEAATTGIPLLLLGHHPTEHASPATLLRQIATLLPQRAHHDTILTHPHHAGELSASE